MKPLGQGMQSATSVLGTSFLGTSVSATSLLGTLLLGTSLLAPACTTALPGEVDAGLFEFFASTAWNAQTCKPDMAAEGSLAFEGRFRLEADLVDGYFIYRGVHRAAQFDGQKMVSEYTAEHSAVEGCEGCNQSVVEVLEIDLLSKTQDEALGGQCPCEVLAGGIGVDAAQNISPPGPVPGGFDALRACGALTVRVETTAVPGQLCPEKCHRGEDEQLRYYVEGIRKE